MKPQLVSRDIKYNQSKPISSMNAHPVCMRQSISNQLAMEKQSHAVQTGRTVTTHVLKKKKSRPEQRATGPTYEAGLPACTRGAVGRVVTGLRVGRKVKKGQTKKIPLLKNESWTR